MRVFHCDHCQQLVFFENTQCVKCNHQLTAYASSHPWEDWAESWAHYLHMIDTLETAAFCGLSLRPDRPNEPTLSHISGCIPMGRTFDELIGDWFAVTYILNNFNRGLGHADAYPFVLPGPAIEKLRFIDGVIRSQRLSTSPAIV